MSAHWWPTACSVALILTWPLNLFLKWQIPESYIHGLLVDYLIPKLFVSDFVIIAIVISGWKRWGFIFKNALYKTNNQIVLIGWGILFLGQFFTPLPVIGVYTAVKLSALFLAAITLYSWQKEFLINKKLTFFSIFLVAASQLAMGAYQFLKQASLFPSYMWFGETRLNSFSGIARGTFNGVEKILAYGTTSHPNIWAGILLICIWMIFHYFSDRGEQLRWKKWLFFLFLSPVILFSLSVSAGISAIFAGSSLYFQKYKYASILLATIIFTASPFLLSQSTQIWPQNTSISRRVWLNEQAIQIWKQYPITGTGLGQFTLALDSRSLREPVQFVQPVHHIGLLWLSETGLLGILILGNLLKLFWSKWRLAAQWFLILTPLASFDHYLLTNQVGMLLVLISGFIYLSGEESSAESLF